MEKIISKDKYANRIFEDIKKVYKNSLLENDKLIIETNQIRLDINMDEPYRLYANSLAPNYNVYRDRFINSINQELKEIICENILPVIQKVGSHNSINFVRNKFVLDLEVIFVNFDGEDILYLTDDNSNNEEIIKHAYNNLKKVKYTINKVDDNSEIYCLHSLKKLHSKKDDFVNSILLNLDKEKKVIDLLGENFLFLMVNFYEIIFAKETPLSVATFKTTINDYKKKNGEDSLISDKIYRYSNGKFYFYDNISNLKVIK